MLRALLFSLFSMISSSALAGEIVTYKDGSTVLEGYLAKANKANAPVVMVVHQWMGLGDNEKMRADMLAEQGYNAFAIDMYGQGVRPANTDEAGVFATKYKTDPTLARGRLNAALAYAKTILGVDPARIAIIGYCFGGTMALELARTGADIKSAISFHGGLGSQAPVLTDGVIKAAIAVHHGADDPYVPPSEVESFAREMKTAKADLVLTSYSGAVHAFTQKEAGNDVTKGAAYNEKADKRSWAAALDFLAETLGQ